MMSAKDIPLLPGFEPDGTDGKTTQRQGRIEIRFCEQITIFYSGIYMGSFATLREFAEQARILALDEIDDRNRFICEMDAILAAEEWEAKGECNG